MSEGSSDNSRRPINLSLHLNTLTVILMYGAVILFYVAEMLSIPAGQRSADVWLSSFVDAVTLTTFTYALPVSLHSIFDGGRGKIAVWSMWLLVADIFYILIYGVFRFRAVWANILLCIFTIVLVVWVSILQVKGQATTGNAENKMKDRGFEGSSSENQRITG